LPNQQYNLDLRKVGIAFRESGWAIDMGDVALGGAEEDQAFMHGGSVSYTRRRKTASEAQYMFLVSGGVVARNAFDYFNVSTFTDGDEAVGGRFHINTEDYELRLGMSAYNFENSWTTLASAYQQWRPSRHFELKTVGSTFREKNRAAMLTSIFSKYLNVSGNYEYVQENYPGFGPDQLLPRLHRYALSLEEIINRRVSLYQSFGQSFTFFESPDFSQDGSSLTASGGIGIYLGKVTGSAGFTHVQTESDVIRNGELTRADVFSERFDTRWEWEINDRHLLNFRFYETLDKIRGTNPKGWDWFNSLELNHKWTPIEDFYIYSVLGADFYPDKYSSSRTSLDSTAYFNIDEWELGPSFSIYIFGDNSMSLREGILVRRTLGKYFFTSLQSFFTQNIGLATGQDLFNLFTLRFQIGMNLPVNAIDLARRKEDKKLARYMQDKAVKHKIRAVFDKNQNLSVDSGEKGVKGLVFVIEGKEYTTGGSGVISFSSTKENVSVELLPQSIPQGVELLNPALEYIVNTLTDETIYYFGEPVSMLRIRLLIDTPQGIQGGSVLSGVGISVYDAETNKLIQKFNMGGEEYKMFIPVSVKRVRIKIDEETLPAGYVLDEQEKTINLQLQTSNEVVFSGRGLL
jgi:hypothetical protein